MKTTPNAQLPRGCGRQEELVTYLYDEATAAERAAFEQHLDACADCRRELRAFERVRHDLSAWQLPLAPRAAITPQRNALAVLRELLGSLSFWPKAAMGAAAMAAMMLIIFAVIGTHISVGQGQGFSVDFGNMAKKTEPTPPASTLTRAEAEALIQEATARVRAQAQEETQARLASLEERLGTAYQAELAKVTRRLYAEQRTMLANANKQETTLREWLFATNETRDGGGAENDKLR